MRKKKIKFIPDFQKRLSALLILEKYIKLKIYNLSIFILFQKNYYKFNNNINKFII